jgi:hypothetical protein
MQKILSADKTLEFSADLNGALKNICVYGFSGRLIRREISMKKMINLRDDLGLPVGFYIIRMSLQVR